MYFAKSNGKRAHALFTPSMHTSALDRLRTGAELRHAVDNGELEPFYQPIVALAGGEVTGAEALLRWHHPTRGLLAPAAFLPVAEESELGTKIGTWVLRAVCRQIAEWDSGSGRESMRVSVNVSNRQFWQGRLIDDVVESLAMAGVDPHRLAIEITEGVIMRDLRHAGRTLTDLRAIGVQVHIDDFGTGYSSLEALHDLPFDVLKIDRSFVSRLAGSPRSRELVRTIITMGRNLNVAVVAEGIETDEEHRLLRDLGCTHGQGFLFAPPVPAGQFRPAGGDYRLHC